MTVAAWTQRNESPVSRPIPPSGSIVRSLPPREAAPPRLYLSAQCFLAVRSVDSRKLHTPASARPKGPRNQLRSPSETGGKSRDFAMGVVERFSRRSHAHRPSPFSIEEGISRSHKGTEKRKAQRAFKMLNGIGGAHSDDHRDTARCGTFEVR